MAGDFKAKTRYSGRHVSRLSRDMSQHMQTIRFSTYKKYKHEKSARTEVVLILLGNGKLMVACDASDHGSHIARKP